MVCQHLPAIIIQFPTLLRAQSTSVGAVVVGHRIEVSSAESQRAGLLESS